MKILMALFLGLAVGNLPDHGVVWLGFKVVFTFVAACLAFRIARRDAERRQS